MHHDDLEFHNVGELRSIDGHPGEHLQRTPETVRLALNEGARERMRHPAGVEIRFVADGPVRITLSSRVRESVVQVFWGPFQGGAVLVGTEPRTIELSCPESIAQIEPAVAANMAYAPQVCRLRLPGEHRGGHVYYHGVDGDARLPRDDELPNRRYLAYGTSITEGEAATAEHLTYVNLTAERLRADSINLGSCGSAYCDAAMAEYIAERGDWDVATLAVSVNMIGTFSVETFHDRAANMIETVAGAHPDEPVVCITIYPHYRDIRKDTDKEMQCERFRSALRDIVAATEYENVYLIEGADILSNMGGLTADLIHPGDGAMREMGRNLSQYLEPLLSGVNHEEQHSFLSVDWDL